MCYLIAKNRFAHGCIALKTTHRQHLADLKHMLNFTPGNEGIEFVTIAYMEYAPYRFAENEEEFLELVKAMRA